MNKDRFKKLAGILKEYEDEEAIKSLVKRHRIRNLILAAPEGEPKSSSDVDALEYAMNEIIDALREAYAKGYSQGSFDEQEGVKY